MRTLTTQLRHMRRVSGNHLVAKNTNFHTRVQIQFCKNCLGWRPATCTLGTNCVPTVLSTLTDSLTPSIPRTNQWQNKERRGRYVAVGGGKVERKGAPPSVDSLGSDSGEAARKCPKLREQFIDAIFSSSSRRRDKKFSHYSLEQLWDAFLRGELAAEPVRPLHSGTGAGQPPRAISQQASNPQVRPPSARSFQGPGDDIPACRTVLGCPGIHSSKSSNLRCSIQ